MYNDLNTHMGPFDHANITAFCCNSLQAIETMNRYCFYKMTPFILGGYLNEAVS